MTKDEPDEAWGKAKFYVVPGELAEERRKMQARILELEAELAGGRMKWRPVAEVREQLLPFLAVYLRTDEFGVVRARTVNGMQSDYHKVLCIGSVPLVLPPYKEETK